MRHRHGLRKLNRTSSHRLAMLRNMTNSLLTHEVIKTTLPKAKELRRVAEPMITLAKEPTLANRRLAFDRLRDRDVVSKLFNELGPRYKARPGGYLRILKFGFRVGDNAPMALVELVDRPEQADRGRDAHDRIAGHASKQRAGHVARLFCRHCVGRTVIADGRMRRGGRETASGRLKPRSAVAGGTAATRTCLSDRRPHRVPAGGRESRRRSPEASLPPRHRRGSLPTKRVADIA